MEKLIATRADGAKLFMVGNKTIQNNLGKDIEIEIGYIESPDGNKSVVKDLINLTKFNNDWVFIQD